MRELEEETGMRAKRYIYLGKALPTPGFCGEVIHMYLALDLYEGKLNRDEDEFMEIVRVPLCELVDKVLSGEIVDAKTALALMKVNEMKNRGLI
jgi:ADP-ribose pyrophosphatase